VLIAHTLWKTPWPEGKSSQLALAQTAQPVGWWEKGLNPEFTFLSEWQMKWTQMLFQIIKNKIYQLASLEDGWHLLLSKRWKSICPSESVLFITTTFFFWQNWGLNSELYTCKAGVLPLEWLHQSILLWLFCKLILPIPASQVAKLQAWATCAWLYQLLLTPFISLPPCPQRYHC
jgi:hypothetical protein